MSMTFKELHDTRNVEKDGHGNFIRTEIHYVLKSDTATNEESAVEHIRSNVPYYVNGIPLSSIVVDERANDKFFKITAQYARDTTVLVTGSTSDSSTLSFDCSSGSQHIVRAYSQRRAYGPKDAKNLIGWNGKAGEDIEVNGVDVTTPEIRVTFTKVMQLSSLRGNSFMRKIVALTGKVNNATWKGWNKGEAKFLGCSNNIPVKGREDVNVTFNFEIRLNERVFVNTDGTITVDDDTNVEPFTDVVEYITESDHINISGGTFFKAGHEYIWGMNESEIVMRGTGTESIVDERNNITIKGLYISEVCKYADFSQLGL